MPEEAEMENTMKYDKDQVIVKTTPVAVSSGVAGAGITFPSIVWNADHYDALCCAVTYNGVNYNDWAFGPCPYSGGSGYTIYSMGIGVSAYASIPSLTNDHMEPQYLSRFDGTEDLDLILCSNPDYGNSTIVSPHDKYDDVIDMGLMTSYTVVFLIESVFTHNGSGESYTFNASAIASAGAELWGGDGCGGERTIGIESTFPAGTTILTFEPAHDVLILGAVFSFDAAGENRRLPCMVKMDGADAFPLPMFDSVAGGATAVEFPGRVRCAAGGTVTVDVVEENSGGGAVQIALLYAEV
jgi:hypothetical protein